MNKTIRLVLILSLTLTLPLFAKEFLKVKDITVLSESATAAKYPDSDAVVIDDFIQSEYHPDGTSETWDDTAYKLLTEKGKRDSLTLSLSFNVSYGSSEFTKVQVIKPNGTVNEVDIAAQSKVMVDPSQMSANIYNPNSKILTLSVPGLEVGDTLRYISHRTTTATVVPDSWSDYQVFEHTSPIERTTYQVIAPKVLPLKKIALKSEIPGTVTFDKLESEQSDKIVYTWEVSDVPRMFEEPDMPKLYTVVQRLLVSTVDEWEDLSKWYWDLCEPRLATTPEMEAKAQELVADSTNTLQKIEAMFNFVSQDIRYMGITTEEEAPGYEPHDVKITFENRYGVCRDKAALLAAMLRVVDVEAFPVIIMSGPKKDEEVPQPFFNHAVTAALGDDGEYVLMDSTDENTKDIFPAYLQDMSYLVARPEGETLLTSPIIPAEKNLAKITTAGSLDGNGTLTAESSILFEGINDTVFRGYFSQLKPEELKRFFEGQLKRSVPTAELQSIEILPTEMRDTTQPLTAKLGYTARNLLIEGPNNKLLNLPRLGGSLGYASFLIGQTGLEKRNYPLNTGVTAGVRETLELDIPTDAGTLKIPDYQTIKTPQMIWDMQVAQSEGKLTATNTFLLSTVEFSPEEYLALKQNLKDIEYNKRKKLILDTSAAKNNIPSDVRIIENTTAVVLEDSSNWKQTSRVKLEILTYAGKKDNSEIKLNYNPAWQTVELTKATVTHPDGTVKEISDEELNIMDAGWVASAKRYPAEKILVANLPGVEIGSILEYEMVSTATGKPFFSARQTFNGHSIIDQKIYTVTAPDSLELAVRNSGIKETKTASDGTITYTWQAENQRPVKKEEGLPAWWTFNPAVFVSTGNWGTYAKEVHSHLKAATEHQEQAAELAKKMTYGMRSDEMKAIALRDWVAKNLRAAGPGLTSLPLSAITPADQTLQERYGNTTDRMIVLYTLLDAAKLKPEFVLSGGISLIPEAAEPLLVIPSRTAFNAVLIKLDIDGETIYLNGASQYAELGTSSYHRRPLLNLESGEIGTVEVAPGKDNQSHATIEMSIAANGETGITQSSIRQGTSFESFHSQYAEITPEKRRRQHLEMVSAMSQSAKAASDLVADYSSYPGILEFSVSAERYAVQDGEYLYFTIPGGLGGLLRYRSSTRENPLAWNGYVDTTLEYNIVLPDGYEPVLLPNDYSWQAPSGAGLVEVAVQYSARANAIRIVQMADLKPALIPAKDFPNIIEASRTLAHPDMRTILLKKKQD